MKISFEATFQGSNCIQIDDDNSARVKFACDAGQIAQVVKLLTLQGQSFLVTIERAK